MWLHECTHGDTPHTSANSRLRVEYDTRYNQSEPTQLQIARHYSHTPLTMRKYRLAILECDTPVEAVLEKLGTYGTIYDAFVRRGLEAYVQDGGRSDIDLEVTTSNMVDMGALPPLDQVDGLMLTGSSECALAPRPTPRD